jgi:cytochrome c oxidase subunit IV
MSDHSPENFQGYGKRCLMIFGIVMIITLMMVGVHYAHLSVPAGIALTLAAALVNATLVAGYLMHIVSERKLTITVLLFTLFFFVMLFVLTIGARLSVPQGTVH